jgi:hypothetical protein
MSLAAKHRSVGNRPMMFGRLLTEFPMNFYKYYIVRRHFTGGTTGLRYAAIQSAFRVRKVYRIFRASKTMSSAKSAFPSSDDEMTCAQV